MGTGFSDQEIVADLTKKIATPPKTIEYDEAGHLLTLDLSELNLSQLLLPTEIGRLTNLRVLSLDNTQLSQLPPEIWQLTNLRELNLRSTRLSQLPAEIGRLTRLRKLSLSGTQLSQVPPEIGKLTNLQTLSLRNTQLSQVPPEIGKLTSLQTLYLYDTQLSELPPEIGRLTNLQTLFLDNTRLDQLPPEIGRLTNLRVLSLDNTQLSQLPPEIWQLTNLRELNLRSTRLSQLPAEIGRLTRLRKLSLSGTQLSQVPPEIGKLTNLQRLSLRNTQLSQVSPEIGKLTNLQELYLGNTQLSELPVEIGKLTRLRGLYLRSTRLRQLPVEIGQLKNLQTLAVTNVPTLLTPPPEVIARGTPDILAFLRELQEKSIPRFESKLLIVGEGGTGKSSLLRALRNDAFDPELPPTHGIEINRLELSHPDQGTIILNTWDFGGQHIYHATHQFFLTKRSLYIVVWNARLGAEQARLRYWLDTIKALAPDSPVLLVVTHIDEWHPDLNYQGYKKKYPQLVGNLGVSNKEEIGLAELKSALIDQALQLPLMGQPLPQKWLAVENALLDRPEQYIDLDTYTGCCESCGVEAGTAKGELGNYLHDLGKILYFRDDYVLSNLVVLKPNWVTKTISLVLDDKTIRQANGILLHSELPRIWATDEEGRPYEPSLYPVFLRLMERFELSYQLEADKPGDHSKRSLIPQLLPSEPPISVSRWPKLSAKDLTQVEIVYRFGFVPAGIMNWFIVRTHRYTQNLHWREGVMLAYEGHLARVELDRELQELQLVVQGSSPQNFFTILKNTVDLILDRFEGLDVQREVPCICHLRREGAEPCPRFYRYEDLIRRMEAGKQTIECSETLVDVSVPEMLYGIHSSTNDQVIADIKYGQQEIRKQLADLKKLDTIQENQEKLDQQVELFGRDFTRFWNQEMRKMEAECPSTFVLLSGSSTIFNPKNWVGQEYRLYLVCQHPPGPHRVGKGYPLRKNKEWWVTISPWLNRLINFLKFAVPMGKAIGGVYDSIDIKPMQADIDLLEEIIKSLPEFAVLDPMKDLGKHLDTEQIQQTIGPALRALHSFLDKEDSGRIWGGLDKISTPDGNILWLCDTHRQQYMPKPLVTPT